MHDSETQKKQKLVCFLVFNSHRYGGMKSYIFVAAIVWAIFPFSAHADRFSKGWGLTQEEACVDAKDAAEIRRRNEINGPFRHRIRETGGCKCFPIEENSDGDKYFCQYAYYGDYY